MNPTQLVFARQQRDENWYEVEDLVVVEEPLEIRVNGRAFSATMRTPQNEEADRFLALGLLLSEGLIESFDDVVRVDVRARCRELNANLSNVVDVVLEEEPDVSGDKWRRSLISNSSCGLCGHASVEALSARVHPLSDSILDVELLRLLPAKMRKQQTIWTQTGGLHAAAIFGSSGELLACFEDIGRHNATDKAIGFCLQNGLLFGLAELTLLVSGRASFEIVQKALRARIQTVAGVSAASNLAVELARANNLNLVGFLRERGMTVYCGITK